MVNIIIFFNIVFFFVVAAAAAAVVVPFNIMAEYLSPWRVDATVEILIAFRVRL